MAAFLAFALPHALFHLTHPADALSGTEDVVNTATLWLSVAIAVAIMVAALRSDGQLPNVGDGGEGAGEQRLV